MAENSVKITIDVEIDEASLQEQIEEFKAALSQQKIPVKLDTSEIALEGLGNNGIAGQTAIAPPEEIAAGLDALLDIQSEVKKIATDISQIATKLDELNKPTETQKEDNSKNDCCGDLLGQLRELNLTVGGLRQGITEPILEAIATHKDVVSDGLDRLHADLIELKDAQRSPLLPQNTSMVDNSTVLPPVEENSLGGSNLNDVFKAVSSIAKTASSINKNTGRTVGKLDNGIETSLQRETLEQFDKIFNTANNFKLFKTFLTGGVETLGSATFQKSIEAANKSFKKTVGVKQTILDDLFKTIDPDLADLLKETLNVVKEFKKLFQPETPEVKQPNLFDKIKGFEIKGLNNVANKILESAIAEALKTPNTDDNMSDLNIEVENLSLNIIALTDSVERLTGALDGQGTAPRKATRKTSNKQEKDWNVTPPPTPPTPPTPTPPTTPDNTNIVARLENAAANLNTARKQAREAEENSTTQPLPIQVNQPSNNEKANRFNANSKAGNVQTRQTTNIAEPIAVQLIEPTPLAIEPLAVQQNAIEPVQGTSSAIAETQQAPTKENPPTKNPSTDETAPQKQKDPAQALEENFQQIFHAVLAQTTNLDGKSLENYKYSKDEFKPKIAVDKRLKNEARYDHRTGTVQVGTQLQERLATGKLTNSDLKLLAHELRHAIQMGFKTGNSTLTTLVETASKKGEGIRISQRQKGIKLETQGTEEQKRYARKSTEIFLKENPNLTQALGQKLNLPATASPQEIIKAVAKIINQIELDAYAFGDRFLAAIQQGSSEDELAQTVQGLLKETQKSNKAEALKQQKVKPMPFGGIFRNIRQTQADVSFNPNISASSQSETERENLAGVTESENAKTKSFLQGLGKLITDLKDSINPHQAQTRRTLTTNVDREVSTVKQGIQNLINTDGIDQFKGSFIELTGTAAVLNRDLNRFIKSTLKTANLNKGEKNEQTTKLLTDSIKTQIKSFGDFSTKLIKFAGEQAGLESNDTKTLTTLVSTLFNNINNEFKSLDISKGLNFSSAFNKIMSAIGKTFASASVLPELIGKFVQGLLTKFNVSPMVKNLISIIIKGITQASLILTETIGQIKSALPQEDPLITEGKKLEKEGRKEEKSLTKKKEKTEKDFEKQSKKIKQKIETGQQKIATGRERVAAAKAPTPQPIVVEQETITSASNEVKGLIPLFKGLFKTTNQINSKIPPNLAASDDSGNLAGVSELLQDVTQLNIETATINTDKIDIPTLTDRVNNTDETTEESGLAGVSDDAQSIFDAIAALKQELNSQLNDFRQNYGVTTPDPKLEQAYQTLQQAYADLLAQFSGNNFQTVTQQQIEDLIKQAESIMLGADLTRRRLQRQVGRDINQRIVTLIDNANAAINKTRTTGRNVSNSVGEELRRELEALRQDIGVSANDPTLDIYVKGELANLLSQNVNQELSEGLSSIGAIIARQFIDFGLAKVGEITNGEPIPESTFPKLGKAIAREIANEPRAKGQTLKGAKQEIGSRVQNYLTARGAQSGTVNLASSVAVDGFGNIIEDLLDSAQRIFDDATSGSGKEFFRFITRSGLYFTESVISGSKNIQGDLFKLKGIAGGLVNAPLNSFAKATVGLTGALADKFVLGNDTDYNNSEINKYIDAQGKALNKLSGILGLAIGKKAQLSNLQTKSLQDLLNNFSKNVGAEFKGTDFSSGVNINDALQKLSRSFQSSLNKSPLSPSVFSKIVQSGLGMMGASPMLAIAGGFLSGRLVGRGRAKSRSREEVRTGQPLQDSYKNKLLFPFRFTELFAQNFKTTQGTQYQRKDVKNPLDDAANIYQSAKNFFSRLNLTANKSYVQYRYERQLATRTVSNKPNNSPQEQTDTGTLSGIGDSGIADKFKEILSNVFKGGSNLGLGAMAGIGVIATAVVTSLKRFGNVIKNFISYVSSNPVNRIFSDIQSGAAILLNDTGTSIKRFSLSIAGISAIITALLNNFKNLNVTVRNFIDRITGNYTLSDPWNNQSSDDDSAVGVKQAAQQIIKQTQGIANTVGNTARKVGQNIVDTARQYAPETVGNLEEKIGTALTQAGFLKDDLVFSDKLKASDIKNQTGGLKDDLLFNAKLNAPNTHEQAENAIKKTKSAFNSVTANVKKTVQAIATKPTGNFPTVLDPWSSASTGGDTEIDFTSVTERPEEILNQVGAVVKNAVTDVTTRVKAGAQVFSDSINNIQDISDPWQTSVQTEPIIFNQEASSGGLANQAQKGLKNFSQALKTTTGAILKDAQAIAPETFEKATANVEATGAALNDLKDFAVAAGQELAENAKRIAPEPYQQASDAIANTKEVIVNSIKAGIKAPKGTVKNNIESYAPKTVEQAKKLAATSKAAAQNLGQVLTSEAQDIAKGIQDNSPEIYEKAATVFDKASVNIQKAGQTLQSVSKTIKSTVVGNNNKNFTPENVSDPWQENAKLAGVTETWDNFPDLDINVDFTDLNLETDFDNASFDYGNEFQQETKSIFAQIKHSVTTITRIVIDLLIKGLQGLNRLLGFEEIPTRTEATPQEPSNNTTTEQSEDKKPEDEKQSAPIQMAANLFFKELSGFIPKGLFTGSDESGGLAGVGENKGLLKGLLATGAISVGLLGVFKLIKGIIGRFLPNIFKLFLVGVKPNIALMTTLAATAGVAAIALKKFSDQTTDTQPTKPSQDETVTDDSLQPAVMDAEIIKEANKTSLIDKTGLAPLIGGAKNNIKNLFNKLRGIEIEPLPDIIDVEAIENAANKVEDSAQEVEQAAEQASQKATTTIKNTFEKIGNALKAIAKIAIQKITSAIAWLKNLFNLNRDVSPPTTTNSTSPKPQQSTTNTTTTQPTAPQSTQQQEGETLAGVGTSNPFEDLINALGDFLSNNGQSLVGGGVVAAGLLGVFQLATNIIRQQLPKILGLFGITQSNPPKGINEYGDIAGAGMEKFLDTFQNQLGKFGDRMGLSDAEKTSLGAEATGFMASVAGMFAPQAVAGAAVAPIAAAFLPFSLSFMASIRSLTPLVQRLIEAMTQIQPILTRLNSVAGSQEKGQQMFKFAQEVSAETGTPLLAGLEGYSKLASASKNTRLEGEATADLFKGISQAAAALGMDSESVNYTILGFSQVISKGVVTMEELRGQIAERMPSALGIFSRALGVSQEQLIQMVQRGEVLASSTLPRVAKQLQKEFGDGAANAAGSFIAATNRIQSAMTGLNLVLMDKLGGALTFFTHTYASMLEGLVGITQGASSTLMSGLIGVVAQVFAGFSFISVGSGIVPNIVKTLKPIVGKVAAFLTPMLVGLLIDTSGLFVGGLIGATVRDGINLMIDSVVSLINIIVQGVELFKDAGGAIANVFKNINKFFSDSFGSLAKFGGTIAIISGIALAFSTWVLPLGNIINILFQVLGIIGTVTAVVAGFISLITGIFGADNRAVKDEKENPVVKTLEAIWKGVKPIIVSIAELFTLFIVFSQLTTLLTYLGAALRQAWAGLVKYAAAVRTAQKETGIFSAVLKTVLAGLSGMALRLTIIFSTLFLLLAEGNFINGVISPLYAAQGQVEKLSDRLDDLAKNRKATLNIEGKVNIEQLNAPIKKDMQYSVKGWSIPFGLDEAALGRNVYSDEFNESLNKRDKKRREGTIEDWDLRKPATWDSGYINETLKRLEKNNLITGDELVKLQEMNFDEFRTSGVEFLKERAGDNDAIANSNLTPSSVDNYVAEIEKEANTYSKRLQTDRLTVGRAAFDTNMNNLSVTGNELSKLIGSSGLLTGFTLPGEQQRALNPIQDELGRTIQPKPIPIQDIRGETLATANPDTIFGAELADAAEGWQKQRTMMKQRSQLIRKIQAARLSRNEDELKSLNQELVLLDSDMLITSKALSKQIPVITETRDALLTAKEELEKSKEIAKKEMTNDEYKEYAAAADEILQRTVNPALERLDKTGVNQMLGTDEIFESVVNTYEKQLKVVDENIANIDKKSLIKQSDIQTNLAGLSSEFGIKNLNLRSFSEGDLLTTQTEKESSQQRLKEKEISLKEQQETLSSLEGLNNPQQVQLDKINEVRAKIVETEKEIANERITIAQKSVEEYRRTMEYLEDLFNRSKNRIESQGNAATLAIQRAVNASLRNNPTAAGFRPEGVTQDESRIMLQEVEIQKNIKTANALLKLILELRDKFAKEPDGAIKEGYRNDITQRTAELNSALTAVETARTEKANLQREQAVRLMDMQVKLLDALGNAASSSFERQNNQLKRYIEMLDLTRTAIENIGRAGKAALEIKAVTQETFANIVGQLKGINTTLLDPDASIEDIEKVSKELQGLKASGLMPLGSIGKFGNILQTDDDPYQREAEKAKIKAMLQEQAIALTLFELERKREETAAKIAKREAEIAEIKARQAVIQAAIDRKKALVEYQKTGDESLVVAADLQLQAAIEGLGLAREQVLAASENVQVQEFISQTGRGALELEQELARKQEKQRIISSSPEIGDVVRLFDMLGRPKPLDLGILKDGDTSLSGLKGDIANRNNRRQQRATFSSYSPERKAPPERSNTNSTSPASNNTNSGTLNQNSTAPAAQPTTQTNTTPTQKQNIADGFTLKGANLKAPILDGLINQLKQQPNLVPAVQNVFAEWGGNYDYKFENDKQWALPLPLPPIPSITPDYLKTPAQKQQQQSRSQQSNTTTNTDGATTQAQPTQTAKDIYNEYNQKLAALDLQKVTPENIQGLGEQYTALYKERNAKLAALKPTDQKGQTDTGSAIQSVTAQLTEQILNEATNIQIPTIDTFKNLDQRAADLLSGIMSEESLDITDSQAVQEYIQGYATLNDSNKLTNMVELLTSIDATLKTDLGLSVGLNGLSPLNAQTLNVSNTSNSSNSSNNSNNTSNASNSSNTRTQPTNSNPSFSPTTVTLQPSSGTQRNTPSNQPTTTARNTSNTSPASNSQTASNQANNSKSNPQPTNLVKQIGNFLNPIANAQKGINNLQQASTNIGGFLTSENNPILRKATLKVFDVAQSTLNNVTQGIGNFFMPAASAATPPPTNQPQQSNTTQQPTKNSFTAPKAVGVASNVRLNTINKTSTQQTNTTQPSAKPAQKLTLQPFDVTQASTFKLTDKDSFGASTLNLPTEPAFAQLFAKKPKGNKGKQATTDTVRQDNLVNQVAYDYNEVKLPALAALRSQDAFNTTMLNETMPLENFDFSEPKDVKEYFDTYGKAQDSQKLTEIIGLLSSIDTTLKLSLVGATIGYQNLNLQNIPLGIPQQALAGDRKVVDNSTMNQYNNTLDIQRSPLYDVPQAPNVNLSINPYQSSPHSDSINRIVNFNVVFNNTFDPNASGQEKLLNQVRAAQNQSLYDIFKRAIG